MVERILCGCGATPEGAVISVIAMAEVRSFLRLFAAVAAAAVALALTPAIASAAPGDIGTEDFNYAPIGGSPSGSKPESKMWFTDDGVWWASMFDPVSQNHMIFRLNRQTQQWTNTGVTIDTRNSTRADTLFDGTKNLLYVASHGFTTSASTSTTNNGRLWRYKYDPATQKYSLDTAAGFTAAGVRINTAQTETLVIDQDSTDRLWATWTQGNQVWVANTTNSTNTQWSSPITVPGSTTLNPDDISSLIAFKVGPTSQIGVMWSNQVDHKFWFATHPDLSALGTGWSAAAIPNTQSSDDHINLKTLDGRVYAAVKHSTTGSLPLTSLLVRDPSPTPNGTWSSTTFGTGSNSHTRPIVLLDTSAKLIRMFATGPQPPSTSGQSGGDIVEKTSSFTNPAFPTGVGSAVIRDNGSPEMNDVTSTKQNITAASGIVLMANNATTKVYWHRDLVDGGGTTTPTAPTASFSPSAVQGPSPLKVDFTNTSTGAPTSFAWDFGDGTTSTAQTPPTHTFSNTTATAKTFTVTLVASNAAGSSAPFTRTITVDPAPTLTASFTATKGADNQTFTFTDTSSGGSVTSRTWDFGDGTVVSGAAATATIDHPYKTAGAFTVTLTVNDGTGPHSANQVIRAGATAGTTTLNPVADTQVKSDSASTNYGTLTTVRVRGGTTASPTTYWTFLRFDVTGVGAVSNAKLRLFVTDDSNDGGTVYLIPNTPAWAETTLNWNNRPVTTLPASGIKAAGPVPLGWIDIDLGTAVTGNGTYNFVLASASTTSAIYSSREGANPPQLVLTTG
jgi:PKD repeat protein